MMRNLGFYWAKFIDNHYDILIEDEAVNGLDNIELFNEFDTLYVELPSKGILFNFSPLELVTSVFLLSSEIILNTDDYKDKFIAYNGKMPEELQWGMEPEDVVKTLGKPNKSGGGEQSILYIPVWYKYYYNNCSLHIQFSKDNKTLDMITLGSLSLEPYLNS